MNPENLSNQVSFNPIKSLREFLKLETASGIILVCAAILALVLNNTFFSQYYEHLLETPLEIRIGALFIGKPLLLWINDGLMAIFFFLIGLEVKREILDGQLSSLSQIALPGFAAIGGMAVPALIFILFNLGNSVALNGWAIPAATDIAFALGVLALLGPRVPLTLKLFLLTLAIIDDLGAIVIIAIFYSSDLSTISLVLAGITLIILFILNYFHITKISTYVIFGIILWICVLKSGVHATLAGVALALAIPLKGRTADSPSPLRTCEHILHPWVAFLIMPVFAFANAGVSLDGLTFSSVLNRLTLGIFFGLFLGKQLGVFGFSWIIIKLGIAKLPEGLNWKSLYGTSILCGIGFTMSLFISTLAYEHTGQDFTTSSRIGILLGSLLSGVLGYLILKFNLKDPDDLNDLENQEN